MRVGLLGALEVHDAADREVVVPSGKQQALLTLLAVHAGRVVSTEQVVDALWGEDPPPRVRNGLQALASKLRVALGSADLVVMRGGGYALELPPDAVDIHEYERLVTEARAMADTEPDRAVDTYNDADALWRGSALADFTYEEFAQPTIARLTELRLAAIEERVDLEIALGRVDQGVIELEALVAAHPLRERLRGQLMVALYRAGRQADALRTFQEGRDILVEELGLEPGPELRRLEAAILAHDPSLDAPTPRASHAAAPQPHNQIPEALNPLVGRDDEVRELLLLAAKERLISLVGPGGVGKTRLVLEVARTTAASLGDGGYLVELVPVGDPESVGAAVAAALDVPDPRLLGDTIGDREMVIVLDNCEHVVEAAAALAEDLLRRCPGLRIIATSREALRVGGEFVWPVPPLAAGDAEQLFLARARAVGARLEITDDLRGLIADICERLDGLPLALELAAARTRALPLQQISSRLHDRFRLLTGGSRTALPRQQTLEAVVDWSYELLFDAEQRVFERLSVLPGGCDLATAETICADDTILADDVADLVQALVDKSLVIAHRAGDTVRFTQLQTLAQYGQQKLAARGDARRTRDAMAAHFATLCAHGKAAYTGPTQRTWLLTVSREHDNLRAAHEWAVANHDAETSLVIAGGSSWTHWLDGTAAEGMRQLNEAFACDGAITDQTSAMALAGRGLLRFIAGDIDAAEEDLTAAREIFLRDNDIEGLRFTLSFYAETARVTGRVDEARRRRQQTLDLDIGANNDPFVIALQTYSRAVLALLDGDLDTAEQHYRNAVVGFAAGDRPVMHAITLGFIADFDERHCRYAAAVDALEEAVELAEATGMRGFVGSLYSRLAWSLLQEGDAATASVMIDKAFDAGRRLGSPHIMFLAFAASAVLHQHHGRADEAAEASRAALRIHEVEGSSRLRNRLDPDFEIASVLAVCHTVLGVLAVDSGDRERGAAHLAEADRLRTEVGAPEPKFQVSDLRRARAALAGTE